MIFGPTNNLEILGSPYDLWFMEAVNRFWWNWLPYGPLYPFVPMEVLNDFSHINHLNARVTVQIGERQPSWNPQEFGSVGIGPDNLGVQALVTIQRGLDKPMFCETAICLILRIAVFQLVEDSRYHDTFPGAVNAGGGDVAVTPDFTWGGAASEEKITALCAMFGQPRSAWETGPWERRVRVAVIELLKEHCADPALLKYRNRSALKLKISPPSLRAGRHWVTTGRALPVEAFAPAEIGNPPEDNPTFFPVEQPHLHNGLYYDTIPADAILSSGGHYLFPEMAPPEWPEALDVFDGPIPNLPPSPPVRLTWPTDQTIPGPGEPKDVKEGTFVFTGGFEESITGGGGRQARAIFYGEYESTGGDFAYGDIPWTGNRGYAVDLIEGFGTYGAWGAIADHFRTDYDELFRPYEVFVPGRPLTWEYVEVSVYDNNGDLFCKGTSRKGQVDEWGYPEGLTNIWSIGSALIEMKMFEADRLPMRRITIKVYTEAINIFVGELPAHYLPGAGGQWEARHYAYPAQLIELTPPWPMVLAPGYITVGPSLSGSHPTVKGLRGGWVTGRPQNT